MVNILRQQIRFELPMQVRRDASYQVKCVPQSPFYGTFSFGIVEEGAKRGVEGNLIDDLLVEDFGRNFPDYVAH